jgi:MFS family permease
MRHPQWDLVQLIAGQICIQACMAGMRMAAPLLALRQGYDPLAVGFLMAFFALTQVFLAVPAGRYADQRGLRRPVGWSIVLASAGAAVAVACPVYPVLCLSALITGGATAVAAISLQRQAGRMATSPTELKTVFSWVSLGPSLSNVIGPMLAGLLIDYSAPLLGFETGHIIGFQMAFCMLAALPLVAWSWIRYSVEIPHDQEPEDKGPRKAFDLLREPMMRRLLVVNWLLASCWDVHTFVVPVLGHERGLSASVIGILLGVFACSAALVRLLLPLMAAHMREWVVVSSAMFGTAIIFALYPFMPGAWAMGLCSATLGLVLGTVQPMIMSTLHQITPSHRHGEALGLRLMSLNGSSVVMPLIFGTLGTVVGVSMVFWSVAALVVPASRLAWGLKPPEHYQSLHTSGLSR